MLVELRARTEATTRDLVDALKLSAPTIRGAVQTLSQRGLIETVPVDTGRPGRPTPRFRFRAESRGFVGVNIDNTETVIRIAGLDGRQVGERRLPSNGRPWDIEYGVRVIADAANSMLPHSSIATMALAVPAWVERDGTMRESPAMPELGGVPLRSELEARFGCPVMVENDVQLAAVGEHRFGAAKGTATFVYLWAGSRVNAAVYVDRHLHRGATGVAGAIGSHNGMGWGAAPLLRPTRQQFASAAVADGPTPDRRAVLRYVDALSSGLSALTLALDPELIVIAGHLPEEAILLADCLEDAIQRDAYIARPKVVPATIGFDARVIGALSLASELGERQILGLGRRPQPASTSVDRG